MRNREIYLGIDVLRFAAAIIVMAYHLSYKAWSMNGYYLHEQLGVADILWPWSDDTWFGWIGVQIFFVISGFVIAFSSASATPSKFLLGRVLRLVPVMWISATICLAVALYWDNFSSQAAFFLYFKSLLFWPFGPWIAGQIWTLPIEIMFYGLVFLLLTVGRFDRIDWLCMGLAVASLVYWLTVWSGIYVDTTGRLTQLFLLQHGCYFALGGALWLMKERGATPMNLAIVSMSLAPTWIQIETSLIWEKPGFRFEQWPIVPYTVWAVSMLLMAASIYWNDLLSRWLSPARGVISAAGRMTYPLYLVHFHIGGLAMVLAFKADLSPPASIGLGFFSSIVVSYAIARWLEKPVASALRVAIYRSPAAA
jgi:peptidoglycan/LPS O-acetylase OafA/YrhL